LRLIPRPNPLKTCAGWPATLGLSILLVLTGVARWQIRALGYPPRAAVPAALRQTTGNPVQVAISADGSITAKSHGNTVALEELTRQLAGPGTNQMVEITVDPRARGAAVDALLNRLREAGQSRCTLLVDLASASASGSASSRTDAPASGETLP
jgi:biopolymer transport protein ExbD